MASAVNISILAAAQPSNLDMSAMAAVVCVPASLLILAAVQDWDWVFNSRKYRIWIKLIGRPACRILLGLVGTSFVVFVHSRLALDWK